MRLTFHAEHRMRQRGVPTGLVDTLYVFGSEYYAPAAMKLILDDQAIDRAAEGDDRLRGRLRQYRGVYIVVSREDAVLTVARVRGRLPRTPKRKSGKAARPEQEA